MVVFLPRHAISPGKRPKGRFNLFRSKTATPKPTRTNPAKINRRPKFIPNLMLAFAGGTAKPRGCCVKL